MTAMSVHDLIALNLTCMIGKMIAIDCQPFSILEDKDFIAA